MANQAQAKQDKEFNLKFTAYGNAIKNADEKQAALRDEVIARFQARRGKNGQMNYAKHLATLIDALRETVTAQALKLAGCEAKPSKDDDGFEAYHAHFKTHFENRPFRCVQRAMTATAQLRLEYDRKTGTYGVVEATADQVESATTSGSKAQRQAAKDAKTPAIDIVLRDLARVEKTPENKARLLAGIEAHFAS